MFLTLSEIERQVQNRPDKAAVIAANQSLTFAELWQWTDEVARQLQAANLDPARPLAYFGSNGISLIVAFIATQKLGLAFFPLNLKYPLIQRHQKAPCQSGKCRARQWQRRPPRP